MEKTLNEIVFSITFLLIFLILSIGVIVLLKQDTKIKNFFNFDFKKYILPIFITMFLSWYFYIHYSYFMLKENNEVALILTVTISFAFILLLIGFNYFIPNKILKKLLYMSLLIYLIVFIINLIFKYNNLNIDFSRIIDNENYIPNFIYNFIYNFSILILLLLFIYLKKNPNFCYRNNNKILIFILLSIFLLFLFYISIYMIQSVYKSKFLSKEYKKKLINLNNNLGLNDNNQENHSIDKNAIKFYDPIDEDNIGFLHIFNDDFDTKHNIDKDDTELYSQNQYRKYYNKIKQELKELKKDQVTDEILIELHNFLILHIPVTFNYSDFIKNSKLSEEVIEQYKNNIELKLSDLKIENNENSVYFKEINKNYKYINGQAGEIKTMILNNTPDNTNINMFLIGYNENETVMDYETFINKVPAKNYACAYLNYFNNYEYGGIDTDKFKKKYKETNEEKVNKINNIFEIDFIDINKNIKIENYIIALVISIITGIIFITIIFKFIKEQNIIKNPEFYSLIIIILFIIAFILGEVIFSRI
jgi:hypothetical protein